MISLVSINADPHNCPYCNGYKKGDIYGVSVIYSKALNEMRISLGISFNDLVIFSETSQ